MASKSKVYFFFDKISIVIKKRERLKEVLEILFIREKKNLIRLNYIFCSDQALLDINRQYLQHDYYTDIITFDLSENDKNQTIGEIYISIDRIKDNANKMKLSVEHELGRVIFHGALHLCGYKDKTKKEQLEIRKSEDYYLKKYLS